MRFLADENIHAELVRWLRATGHDVTYVAEVLSGEPDRAILTTAQRERRIIVTDDTDFGELVFLRRLRAMGSS